MLTIALAKGRVLGETAQTLRGAGLDPPADLSESRKLVVPDGTGRAQYLLAKPVDVPTYVEHGAADLGIVGKDVLLEAEPDVHELLDLGFGRCQMVAAGRPGTNLRGIRRVATKYPGVATSYFRGLGLQIDVIVLHGSVELAPLVGLSDCIVDLVETGRTLKENGLLAFAQVADISARMIVNRRSYQLRGGEVDAVLRALESRGVRA